MFPPSLFEKPKRKAPWKRRSPNKGASLKLTEAEKAQARARAAEAGRRYPNLIDNMFVARLRRK